MNKDVKTHCLHSKINCSESGSLAPWVSGSEHPGRGLATEGQWQEEWTRAEGADRPTATLPGSLARWVLCSVLFSLPQEKEDKAHLQAEVQHLREDNLRLQEESQNASDKLKKFTEWVFNTIDMS